MRRGDYKPLDSNGSIVAYRRGERIAVALNLSSEPAALDLPQECREGEVLLRASSGKPGGSIPSRLDGDEGLVILLGGASE